MEEFHGGYPILEVSDVERMLAGSMRAVFKQDSIVFYLRMMTEGYEHWVMAQGKGLPFSVTRFPFVFKRTTTQVDKDGTETTKTEYVQSSIGDVFSRKYEQLFDIYTEMEYVPNLGDHKPPDGVFNAFTGYRAQVLLEAEEKELLADPEIAQRFALIQTHWRETMCNDNEEYYDYLMNWMAALVKRKEKLRTLIVMTGPQGNGKNAMWEHFFSHGVLGFHNGTTWQSLESFFRKFNIRRMNKRLHIFNEVTSALKRHNSDAMKTLIDGHFLVERKHKTPVNAYDSAGCVVMSNNDVPVKVEKGDRRYAVIHTNAKWAHGEAGQLEYMKNLWVAVRDRRVQNLFLTFLANRNITEFREECIPQTNARESMQMASYEFAILNFFHEVVMYPAERHARDWYNPNVKPYSGRKACWFSWERVLEAYRGFSSGMTFDAERDLKRVTEKVKPDTPRSALLQVRRQRTSRELGERKSRIRCILIDREEVLILTRFLLKKPNWDFNVPTMGSGEDQATSQCAFR